MKNHRLSLLCAFVAASIAASAQSTITTPPPPPATLPTIKLVAPRLDGGNILCTGNQCASLIGYFQSLISQMEVDQQTIIEETPIDSTAFCEALKQQRPSGCSLSSPPASPGISLPGQTAWQPNGCGTGAVANFFLDAVLEVVSSESYSGNLDAPFAGVSFRGACDGHDQCWASGGARHVCDLQFRDSMNAACGALSSPQAAATCSGFASSYHGAVSTTNASHSAYSNSTQARACALWAYDMRENDCDQ